MAAKIDFANFAEDFKTLKNGNPGTWPLLPKLVLLILLFIAVIILGYFFIWSTQMSDLAAKEADEATLKQEYINKKSQSANIAAYEKLLAETEAAFSDLLRRLPAKIELEQILADINLAAINNSVRLSYIRPGQETSRDIYIEQPIEITAVATYEQFGRFAASLASLSRIVTISNISLSGDSTSNPYIASSKMADIANKEYLIEFKTTVKTFRASTGKAAPPAPTKPAPGK